MSTAPKNQPSFSRASRWGNGFDAVLRTALVIAVVVMVNYLGAKFSQRYFWSSQTRVVLSSRTQAVLHSLTNQVEVTLYFDRKADLYADVVALLDEYRAANKKISIRTVDYVRDAGAAELTKAKYKLNAATDKDLIIFDCGGRVKIFPGAALVEYGARGMTEDKKLDIAPVKFNGEKAFTAMLLALESSQPLVAYYTQGHREPSFTTDGSFDFQKVAQLLEQNYLAVTNLSLTGDAPIPADCNLLVIAGPQDPFEESALQKIDQYLREGGRLLLLLNVHSLERATGLESILQRWGVNVVADTVQEHTEGQTYTGQDVATTKFGKHPIMAGLAQSTLQMILPRPIAKLNLPTGTAGAPQVDELMFSSDVSTLMADRTAAQRSYPLACAVEQKPVAGIANLRGTARLVVVGDSIFLGNHYIEGGGNRDFLNSAVNWLIDRPQLLEGVGPRPITEFRLQLTRQQQYQLRWLLLGALPGGVLFLGWLVWLVRRK
jgi:hypothetical protein